MVQFYKTELILGIIILAFGGIFLILFILSGVLLTIGVIIPIMFILSGVYLLYEAFTEPEPEEIKA
ncbi:MAG: hypothetical protein HWN67_06560 [Candidatus Helarchaeota archaeon]|nr:hypothetical protein [Candidatus Helarchaeota archaeon]